jgi:hypothetical protein
MKEALDEYAILQYNLFFENNNKEKSFLLNSKFWSVVREDERKFKI